MTMGPHVFGRNNVMFPSPFEIKMFHKKIKPLGDVW